MRVLRQISLISLRLDNLLSLLRSLETSTSNLSPSERNIIRWNLLDIKALIMSVRKTQILVMKLIGVLMFLLLICFFVFLLLN